MTIREAGEDVVTSFSRMQDYRIGFTGNNEIEITAQNIDELETIWESMVSDLDCDVDDVEYIERIWSKREADASLFVSLYFADSMGIRQIFKKGELKTNVWKPILRRIFFMKEQMLQMGFGVTNGKDRFFEMFTFQKNRKCGSCRKNSKKVVGIIWRD